MQKPIEVVVVSEESSVDREPLVKRMRKHQPTVEKVGESTTVAELRMVEDETEANQDQALEQVASPLVPNVESSNPTGQIRGGVG